jgi:hypothetical protein
MGRSESGAETFELDILSGFRENRAMPYRTRNGRRIKLTAQATNGIQHLVKLEGTRATFECKAGHQHSHDYGKGPVTQRVPEAFLRKMAAYWGLGLQKNGVRGHVYGWCQKCQDETDNEKR